MDLQSGQEDLGYDDDRKWIETFKEKPVGIYPPELPYFSAIEVFNSP